MYEDQAATYVIERIVAQADGVDELKNQLQLATQHIKQIAGVRQVVLFQNQHNPAEFVFFLSVDDLAHVDKLLDQARWHQQLVQELPRLIVSGPERVVGQRIA